MSTSPLLDEREMPHHPEDPVPTEEHESPPPPPPPEPTLESAQLPPNYDPIREKGPAGSYTPTGKSMLFESRSRRERSDDAPASIVSRLPKVRGNAAGIVLSLIAIALVALCFHYAQGISSSQERLETKLTNRQDVLETQQSALAKGQEKLEQRQGTLDGRLGKLQTDVDSRTGGLGTQVKSLQGSVASLSRGVSSKLNAFETRLDRVEQTQRQPQVQGEIRRQPAAVPNTPVTTVPMQRPNTAGGDTHDYEAFQDIVPGGATLLITAEGKVYEIPYTDPQTKQTYKIQVRPYGASTSGTYVHVIRGAGHIQEGQHFVITPGGGWMGPVAR